MNTIFHYSLAWSGHPGETVLAGRASTGRTNEARLYRRTLGPAPIYVSQALTVDSEHSYSSQRTRLGVGKLAIYGAAMLGAAAIGWSAFTVWEFYLAVTHLTTFSQTAGV